MSKLYGSTSWRRVLALILVFVMMFSVMGTSGYSVFAEGLDETGEEVVETPQEAVVEDITDTVLGESPGEEESLAPAEDAEEIAEPEEAADPEADEEVLPEEEAEEAAPAEEEAEEAAEPAEESEEAAEAEEVSEPAEEAAEEEPVSVVEEFARGVEEPSMAYPATGFRDIIGGISVTIDAPEGAFPEGTEMKLAEVEIDSIIDAVSDAVEGTITKIKAVDISFFYEDEEVQPQVPISVRMNASGMTADSDRQVLHIDDEGEATVLEDADTSKKAVEFEADSFSVYVVVAFGEDARVKVRFVKGSEEIASMYVKKGDNMEQVIYDPAIGELPEGVIFKGWIAKEDYTADDTPLSIEGVREEVATMLPPEVDGEEVTYYAVLLRQYTITYLGMSKESLGQGFVNYRADAAGDDLKVTYMIDMAYTPEDDTHDFEGWIVYSGGEFIDGYDPNANPVTDDSGETPVTIKLGTIYQNEARIKIWGDIVLSVNAPEGHWLVFSENGKGGTYNAPQFILTNEVTEEPEVEMTRYGYQFDGWYYFEEGVTIPKPDDHGMIDLTDATPFEFGQPLTERITVYAKWIQKPAAAYTVLLWTQNQDRTGYELAGSYVGNGEVGADIPYTVVLNGAEDYVTGVGENNGHYTGFGLNHDGDTLRKTTGYNADGEAITAAVAVPKVTPEGDAVLNLYYDRIVYNFKFYLYRESGNGTNRYTYANNSGTGSTLNNLVTWHGGSSNHPTASDEYVMASERHTFNNTTYTYHYFTIRAYYGQDISSIWPTYNKITGADGREPVSYVMMVGTKLKPSATSSGSGTVKGIISVMNENILGATNDTDGNYVIVRFPDNYYNWRYHIWLEAAAGEDLTDKTTRTYNGKTYYEEETLIVRSSNTEVSSQNEPKYTGFDFVEKRGQNWDNSNYWTSGNNPTLYHLNYVYNRQKYPISYFDGNYVDGDNNTMQNRATHLLHKSDPIGQGSLIPETDQIYIPTLPEGEEGFVFEGWYADEACTQPYEWDKMLIEGIMVYAKWRQIQYRVFLHPNVPAEDKTLYWGSDDQAMNFRISYGGTISAPTGTRTGYTLVGWYTDKDFKKVFNSTAYILNETTVTSSYDKVVDLTDDMDKWGNGATYNKDVDRFWITKKLDLYAKWRADIEGADGINIQYSLIDPSYDPAITGTGTAEDDNQYVDNAKATAVSAITAPDDYQFAYWVMQKYDATAKAFVDIEGSKVYAGAEYSVLLENAKQDIIRSHQEDVYEEDASGNIVLYDADPGDGGVYVKADDGKHFKKVVGEKTVVDEAVYTIQLRAHYIPVEEAT
ncbi:MAG: InlB B-repeat-containing protein, partial [Lachnospiraceae bacterium]|nr:InlB B-repeat-containing protein [Lachnospiraceae bacterium]